MSVFDQVIPWAMLGALAAIMIVRWVYLVKVDGKALDLRLTPIRILIIIGAAAAILMGIWSVPHGPR